MIRGYHSWFTLYYSGPVHLPWLGTNRDKGNFADAGRCGCSRFLGVPFVMLEDARACIIIRAARCDSLALAYSSSHRAGMIEHELVAESQRSSQVKKKAKEAKMEMDNFRKRLQFDFDRRADNINNAAGKIHTLYSHLTRDFQALLWDRDLQNSENQKHKEKYSRWRTGNRPL